MADAEPAAMALVTPTHQFPLGVTLSLKRRMALLKWASSADGWIVEDDYDSEFRYQGRPIPALKSLDRSDRVLYAGTFSKILAPGFRVGYLVVPRRLVARFKDMAAMLQPPPSRIVQATIAEFMERGHLARHIRRMRALYAERRAAVADALVAQGEPSLSLDLQPGGMHLLARLHPGVDDVAVAGRLSADGIGVTALSACGVDSAGPSGFLLGFTNVATEYASVAANRLVESMRRAARHSA
jgi:GntR family transcriptional regulator/MocR family aminotransferase